MRILEMSYAKESGRHLNYISLSLLEGDITGLIGLADSGKDLLVRLLAGEEKYEDGTICICGKRIVDTDELKKAVYRIVDSNYCIGDWTVAEYIGLVNNRSIFGFLQNKRLIREVQALFEDLNIQVDVQKKLRDLKELEKRLVDVVKACRKQSKVLVIEDEFEGFSMEEIICFKQELSRIVKGRMTVVINNHSDVITKMLSERLVIFKKGKIVKKCRRDFIKSTKHLEMYLLGAGILTKKQTLDQAETMGADSAEIIYQVRQAETHKRKIFDFNFNRGEIVTILALDRKEKEEIFNLISGRGDQQGIIRILGSEECSFHDISDYVRNKIVSVSHLGDFEELLPSMSVGENLLVPSLNKISSLEYTMAEHRLTKMLEKGIAESGLVREERIMSLGINERIVLTLERWLVYNPRVMILLEPFVQCDTYGVSLIKSYIRRIASGGTCVIVIKSREEYMEELTDRFITI